MRLRSPHSARQQLSLRRLPARLVACLIAILVAGCVDRGLKVTTTTVPLLLGSDTVDVVVHASEEHGLTYVNLHDDENTAVSAALATLRRHGGRLIELQHSGDRLLAFTEGGERFQVDPNRIFTRSGIDSTLARGGAERDLPIAVVDTFAQKLLDVVGIDKLAAIVTVHNNGPDRYSARSYLDDGDLHTDALFAHLAAGADADDFFFVTTEDAYVELRDAGFNVVMQNNDTVKDDGSLSVLSARRGVPYINAEAEHGHFEEQVRMLSYLHQVLFGERAVKP